MWILIGMVLISSEWSVKETTVYKDDVYLSDLMDIKGLENVFITHAPFPGKFKTIDKSYVLHKTGLSVLPYEMYKIYRPYRVVSEKDILENIKHDLEQDIDGLKYTYVLKGDDVRIADIDYKARVLNKKKWKAGYNDVLVEMNQEGCSPVRKNYAMHVNVRSNVEVLKKGSSVTVVLKKGLLKITAPGTVLEDSFVNQETTVRVHVSQRVLKTVVKSLNEVEMIW